MMPTGPGFFNGAGGGGQIYTFENQKVLASTIPWVQAGRVAAAHQQSSRAGRFGARFASESSHRRDRLGPGRGSRAIPAALITSDKRVPEILTRDHEKIRLEDRPAPAPAVQR